MGPALRPSAKLKRRLSAAANLSPSQTPCVIPGCARLVQRSAGRGFSQTHCRYHVQYRNRHGSYWKGTYSAAALAPYRKAASRFLASRRDTGPVEGALRGLWLLYLTGNYSPVLEARTRSPSVKASAVVARLRDNDVPRLRVLEAYLAVSAAVMDDPIGPGGPPDEFRLVQVAKAIHRLASGELKDYGEHGSSYRYSRSSGLMLRHLGKLLEEACGGGFAEAAVPQIVADKRAANGEHRQAAVAAVKAFEALGDVA